MDSLNNAISQSLLTRLLANIFGFLLLVACLVVGMIELLNHEAINPLIYSALFTGLGFVLHALGLNQGVTLQAIKPVAKVTVPAEPPAPMVSAPLPGVTP